MAQLKRDPYSLELFEKIIRHHKRLLRDNHMTNTRLMHITPNVQIPFLIALDQARFDIPFMDH
jgi:hypothetical protein